MCSCSCATPMMRTTFGWLSFLCRERSNFLQVSNSRQIMQLSQQFVKRVLIMRFGFNCRQENHSSLIPCLDMQAFCVFVHNLNIVLYKRGERISFCTARPVGTGHFP